MVKKRKTNDTSRRLVHVVKKMTPVVALIREANTNKKLTTSEYYNIIDRICLYDEYGENFADSINIKVVRSLVEEKFTEDQKLAMLYLLFNSSVRHKTRKKIADELKDEFPKEIEAIRNSSYTNYGLETFIK